MSQPMSPPMYQQPMLQPMYTQLMRPQLPSQKPPHMLQHSYAQPMHQSYPPAGYQPPHQHRPMKAMPGWQQQPLPGPAPGGPSHYLSAPTSMNMVPVGVKHNKNKAANKANLRHALIDGNYGI